MYYIVLSIALTSLLIISYFIFEKDILSPSVITCCIYLISTIIAGFSKLFDLWNFVEIKDTTVMLIFVGVLSFIIGEYITRRINKMRKKKESLGAENKENKKGKIIDLSIIKIMCTYIFFVATLIIIYLEMAKITGIYGNISQMINAYRNDSPLFNSDNNTISVSTFAMQLYRMSEILAAILIYIVINNLVLKDKIKNNIKYLIGILIACIITLLLSGRSALVKFIIEAIIIYIIQYHKYQKEKIKKKVIAKFLVIGIAIILPIFYIIMPLIGRSQESNFVSYMTFYLGSPIPSLDEIIQRGEIGNNKYFGQETFLGIESILDRLGVIDYYTPYQRQWIGFNNLSSNVFTGIKSYYSDFGILGIIICQILFAGVFTQLYINAKNNKKAIYTIFYAFNAIMIVDQYRSEKLFARFLSLDTIIYTIYLIIAMKILFKKEKIVKKDGNKGISEKD